MAPALRHTCWAIRRTTTHGTRRRPRIQARQETSFLPAAPKRVLAESREEYRREEHGPDTRSIRAACWRFVEEPQAVVRATCIDVVVLAAGEARGVEIGVRSIEGVLVRVVLPTAWLEADRRSVPIESLVEGRDRTSDRRRPTAQEEGLLRHDAQRRGGAP
ncbi:MAG TPA: hypothetical protein VLA29_07165 [Acidimicrobiia bacterium]|nr:hypothetical protein [Acidimicrobiia bacterium]